MLISSIHLDRFYDWSQIDFPFISVSFWSWYYFCISQHFLQLIFILLSEQHVYTISVTYNKPKWQSPLHPWKPEVRNYKWKGTSHFKWGTWSERIPEWRRYLKWKWNVLSEWTEGPTSPRIVTSKEHSTAYVDAGHCTVNTFIINIPFFTLLSPFRGPNPSRSFPSWVHLKRTREQYLGSLQEPLNKTIEDRRIFHYPPPDS